MLMVKKIVVFLTGSVLIYGLFSALIAQGDGISTLNHYFQKTQTIQGRFIQKVYQADGHLQAESRGVFVIARPNRFRWVYQKPHAETLVSNGKLFWLYQPDLQQVTVRPLSQRLSNAPVMLLGRKKNLSEHYRLLNSGTAHQLNWVTLIPKKLEQGQFRKIEIGFHRTLLSKMILYDQFGHRTVISFFGLKRNLLVKPDRFVFHPPQGVAIVKGS